MSCFLRHIDIIPTLFTPSDYNLDSFHGGDINTWMGEHWGHGHEIGGGHVAHDSHANGYHLGSGHTNRHHDNADVRNSGVKHDVPDHKVKGKRIINFFYIMLLF